MNKKGKTILDSKVFVRYTTAVLFVIAGLLTAIIFGSNNTTKQNLANLLSKADYDCPFEDASLCEGPQHNKSVGDNHNGTYKLSLDVKGEASTTTSTPNANILIVYDTSGSMKAHVEQSDGAWGHATDNYQSLGWGELYTRRTVANQQACPSPSTYVSSGRYCYTPISEGYTGSDTLYIHTWSDSNQSFGNGFTTYSGIRYGATTRGQNAEKVAHDFAEALLAYNTQSEPDNVEMALVTFNTSVTTVQTNNRTWTSSTNYLNHFASNGTSTNLNYDGLTYWQGAMNTAQTVLQSADGDPTFVVFITDGAPTVYSGHTGSKQDIYTSYTYARTPAYNVNNYQTVTNGNGSVNAANSNTQLFAIYAYGDEADYLDDLVYYAYNNATRPTSQGGETAATVETENYFNAANTADLNAAIATIFQSIAETLGVGDVSIEDGTTAKVTTSTGEIAHLLEVDTDSFEYWLSMPTNGNTISRVDPVSGETITINLTDNGDGTITASSDAWGTDGSVTVEGTLALNTFKYKWTGKTNLYNYNPPAAQFNASTGAVDWNLEPLGTLLNNVTYTVTFDVYPSQETYDMVTELENGNLAYADIDPEVRKYFEVDEDGGYTLKTNTLASMTYSDTRPESATSGKTIYYNKLEGEPVVSPKIEVEKVWINALDSRQPTVKVCDDNGENCHYEYLVLDMHLIKDGVQTSEKFHVTYIGENNSMNWKDTRNISTGLLKVDSEGNIQVLDPGYDYTLEEPAAISYHWELTIETIHPMIIGEDLKTLVEVKGSDIPTELASADVNNVYKKIDGKDYYKFNNKVYYAKYSGAKVELKAYNNRKSYIEFKKEVTGDAPAGKEFNFEFKVNNKIGSNEPVENSDVWFSVYDSIKGETVIDLDTNATPEYETEDDGVTFVLDASGNKIKTGYYYVKTGTTVNVKLQKGWNLRVINLGTGSDYTITEKDVAVLTDSMTSAQVNEALEASNPQYFAFDKITYDIKRDNTASTYEPTVTGTKVEGTITEPDSTHSITYTNKYPGTYLTVNKEWIKSETTSVDGKSVQVQLYQSIAGGTETAVEGKVATLNKDNNWTYTFEGLPIATEEETPRTIRYSVKEIEVEGYTSSLEHSSTDGHIWNITNIEKFDLEVTKIWDDANNQDGKRPENITLTLKANGTTVNVEQPTAVKNGNEWTYTYTGLDKFDSEGNLITYTVTESNYATDYYTTEDEVAKESNDYTITNTHTPEKISISGSKVWSDGNNQDGLRPATITVTLTGSNGYTSTQVVQKGENNDWAFTFADLDKYAAGAEITYTLTETQVSGYDEPSIVLSTTLSTDNAKVYTITNTHTPEETSVTATKIWDDANNQDGVRPEAVEFQLYADGNPVLDDNDQPIKATLVAPDNGGNTWTYTWTGLPKYAGTTTPIVYTVVETTDLTTIEGRDYGYDAPTYQTTTVDGEVVEDKLTIINSRDPELVDIPVEKVWDDAADISNRISVTVKLQADGVDVSGKTATLTSENSWKSTFEDLPKYNEGTEIDYSIVETTTVPGYNAPSYSTAEDGTLKVTNTLITTSVSGQKTWSDGFDTSNRPTEIKVNLLRNGSVIDTKTVTANDNNWSYEWTNLPTYVSGKEVSYSVSEEVPTGYTSTVVGYNITNTLITVEVPVTKVWADENQEGNQPTSITVRLKANDTLVEGKTLTLNSGNSWSDKFTNLPKYMNGNTTPVVYTVVEDDIDGYTASVSEATTTTVNGVETISYTITNTLDRTSVTVHKTWDDANNQDGKRPETITVSLNYGGKTATLSESNNWTYTWTGLPVYVDNEVYEYTVTEAQVTGYNEPVVADTVTNEDGTYSVEVTNKRVPETISIQGSKQWDDANNQDGLRTDDTTITVTLRSNDGEDPRTLTVPKGTNNDWAFSFTDLPKYKDGVEIVYTLTETQVPGYETPVVTKVSEANNVVTYLVTNKHEPGKTSVTVHKVWDDADNQDGLRAPSIDVQLYADGNAVEGKTATLDEDNNWTYTFDNLPEFAGTTTPIVYSFEETTTVTGYDQPPVYSTNSETGALEVTNKHVPSVTSVTVHKVWDDADNQDGLRAPSIDVQLYADGTAVEGKTATLNAENEWTYTFENLPEYAGTTTPIEYSFVETTTVTGYDQPAVYSTNSETGALEVTNKHTPEVTSVTASKVWDDSSDQDGKRPEAVEFQLYADGNPALDADDKPIKGTLVAPENGGNTWTITWTGLPKYAGTTTPIVYTVVETTDLTAIGYSAPSYSDDHLTVTNSRETEKTNISVNKVWNDTNNQDGLQPGSVEVVLSSKTSAESSATTEDTVSLSSSNDWTKSWSNLPKYRGGKEITYTVEETKTGVITGTDKEGQYAIKVESKTTETGIEFTVTNTHTPITTEASVKKVWNDNNDQDGVRPTSLTIQLLADGKAVEGKTVTIDSDHLEGTITGLPKYNKSTTPIVYSWSETNLTDDYELTGTSVSGTVTTLTNTHTPETISVTATKVWSDNSNQDGLRNTNTKVTFELYADGVSTGKTLELSGDPAKNTYSGTISGLAKYKDHGTEIVYTVKEVIVPTGYEASAVGNDEAIGNKDNSYTITNTHETETISIDVTKVWSDNSNQDGIRPESIEFQLYANGTAVEGKTVTLTDDKLTATFKDLDKKANGVDIVYTVKETSTPSGYEASAVGNDTATGTADNNYTITNTHTPEEIEVTVKKVWKDNDDQDGLRSAANYSITLTGTREDGTTVTIKNPTVNLTSSVASYTYKNLPKYDGGQLVTYTAEETTVPQGYEASYSEDTFTITNTHTPKTDAVVVTKVWDDEDNRDGKRPENITINLFADTEKVTGVTPTVKKEGNTWTFTFENLPVYRDGGTAIVYTATEEKVDNYVGDPQGLTITNTHTPETIEIPVTKQWVDNNDQDGKRPTSITIELYADDVKYDSITLTKDANTSSTNSNLWEGKFTELPKYREGEVGVEIVYTTKEVSEAVTGNSATGYAGSKTTEFDYVNEHVPSKKSISVTKVWDDANNQDGMRGSSVKVYLYKNGEKQEDSVQTLNESNEWTYTWENLPEYEGGKIITYYVDEDEDSIPEGYSKKVETEDQLNYTITNSHKPIEITISGTKTWDDATDQDGIRPESITVKVLKGEEVVDTITVTAENGWTFESKKLPKFEGGKEIKYTVVEEDVEGYESEIPEGQYNITNKHTPETVTYVITKSWDDEDDNDAIRPESITVKLLADGTVIKTVKVSGPEWTYTFGPLDKNKAGKPIEYTIEEEEVPGYQLIRSTPTVENKTISEVLTNKHTPEKTSINGKKTWVDENNKDGKRPEYITVYVYADGQKIAELTVDANSNWEYELNDLYKYNHSKTPIVYTIEELPVEGYETEYDEFNITNILTEVEGEKEEFPPDTYAEDQATYRIDFLVMLLAGYIITSYRRVIKE